MADIDRIEPHQCREETPVRLSYPVTHQIALHRKACLHPVKRIEKARHRFFVSLHGRRKTGPVDAIVDVLVDVDIELFNLVAKFFWPVIVSIPRNPVKRAVEHADDL